jgi:hypothetical protein
MQFTYLGAFGDTSSRFNALSQIEIRCNVRYVYRGGLHGSVPARIRSGEAHAVGTIVPDKSQCFQAES